MFASCAGDKTGVITFSEFVKTMSVLSGKATFGEKLEFTFKMFDVNGNGKIQRSEMFKLLRKHEQLHRLTNTST